MSNTQYDYDKLFLAYEEARADITAHFRKIMELQKDLAAKDAEIERLKEELKEANDSWQKERLYAAQDMIITDLKSELAEKDAVLEFYSLKSNYSLVDEGRNYSVEYKCYELDEKTYCDMELGTKAKAVLQKYRGKE